MAFLHQVYERSSFSATPEEKLIQRIKCDDKTALEEIFHLYYEGLCRFTLHLTNSRENVEDLVQDIFLKIWSKRENWDPKGSIKAYLFKAARNQALNFLKSERVQKTIVLDTIDEFAPSTSVDPVENVSDNDMLLVVNKSIQKLPQKCRLVFALSRQDGLSYSEISDILNVSERTVENQIMRALKHLRKDLKKTLG